jgi:hypothetical protein
LNAGGKAILSGNLVKLAQRFVRLSGELHATRDAMSRLLLLNGTGSPNENPTPARRPGAKRPQSGRSKMVAAAQLEQTILELLRLSPGLRTAAQRSTADERLKRLQANGLIERDDASAGWRAPA